MTLSHEFQVQIASFFGMRGLNMNPGRIHAENGNVIERFHPKLFWVAQVGFFQPAETLTVAVVHTESWVKGLLLIPPILPPLDRTFGGPQNLCPLILKVKEDKVVTALKSVDLTYDNEYAVLSNLNYNFNMLVVTRNSNATLRFNTRPGDNKSIDKLRDAIFKTIRELVVQYDDTEFHTFTTYKPW
jgi:hypothetical protein